MSHAFPTAPTQGGWNAHHIIRRAVALLAVLMVAVLSACSSSPPSALDHTFQSLRDSTTSQQRTSTPGWTGNSPMP